MMRKNYPRWLKQGTAILLSLCCVFASSNAESLFPASPSSHDSFSSLDFTWFQQNALVPERFVGFTHISLLKRLPRFDWIQVAKNKFRYNSHNETLAHPLTGALGNFVANYNVRRIDDRIKRLESNRPLNLADHNTFERLKLRRNQMGEDDYSHLQREFWLNRFVARREVLFFVFRWSATLFAWLHFSKDPHSLILAAVNIHDAMWNTYDDARSRGRPRHEAWKRALAVNRRTHWNTNYSRTNVSVVRNQYHGRSRELEIRKSLVRVFGPDWAIQNAKRLSAMERADTLHSSPIESVEHVFGQDWIQSHRGELSSLLFNYPISKYYSSSTEFYGFARLGEIFGKAWVEANWETLIKNTSLASWQSNPWHFYVLLTDLDKDTASWFVQHWSDIIPNQTVDDLDDPRSLALHVFPTLEKNIDPTDLPKVVSQVYRLALTTNDADIFMRLDSHHSPLATLIHNFGLGSFIENLSFLVRVGETSKAKGIPSEVILELLGGMDNCKTAKQLEEFEKAIDGIVERSGSNSSAVLYLIRNFRQHIKTPEALMLYGSALGELAQQAGEHGGEMLNGLSILEQRISNIHDIRQYGSILAKMAKSGEGSRLIIESLSQVSQQISSPLGLKEYFDFVGSERNLTLLQAKIALSVEMSRKGISPDKIDFVRKYYAENVRRTEKLTFCRGVTNTLRSEGLINGDSISDWTLFLESFIPTFGYGTNRHLIVAHRLLSTLSEKEAATNPDLRALRLELLGVDHVGPEGIAELQRGMRTFVADNLLKDELFDVSLLDSPLIESVVGYATGFDTAIWGHGSSRHLKMRPFIEEVNEAVSTGRITPISPEYKNLKSFRVRKKGKPEFTDDAIKKLDEYKGLIEQAAALSHHDLPSRSEEFKKSALSQIQIKRNSLAEKASSSDIKPQAVQAIQQQLSKLATLANDINQPNQSLLSLSRKLLANDKEFHDLAVKIVVTEALSDFPQWRNILLERLGDGIEAIPVLLAFRQDVLGNEFLTSIPDKQKASEEILRAIPVGIFEQEISRIKLSNAGSARVRVLGSRRLLGAFAADLGDACYSRLSLKDYLERENPSTVTPLIFTTGEYPDVQFIGSALILENMVHGKPVLIIRALNPSDDFLAEYSAADFIAGVLKVLRPIAKARGARLVAPIGQYGALSNRAEVNVAYAEFAQEEILDLDLPENFNNYALQNGVIHEVRAASVVKSISESLGDMPHLAIPNLTDLLDPYADTSKAATYPETKDIGLRMGLRREVIHRFLAPLIEESGLGSILRPNKAFKFLGGSMLGVIAAFIYLAHSPVLAFVVALTAIASLVIFVGGHDQKNRAVAFGVGLSSRLASIGAGILLQHSHSTVAPTVLVVAMLGTSILAHLLLYSRNQKPQYEGSWLSARFTHFAPNRPNAFNVFGWISLLTWDALHRVYWLLVPTARSIPEDVDNDVHFVSQGGFLGNPFPAIQYSIMLAAVPGITITIESLYGELFRKAQSWSKGNRVLHVNRGIDMENENIKLQEIEKDPSLPIYYYQEESRIFQRFFPGYTVHANATTYGALKAFMEAYVDVTPGLIGWTGKEVGAGFVSPTLDDLLQIMKKIPGSVSVALRGRVPGRHVNQLVVEAA